ncbi:MAG TPA: hypothetical protein PKL15_15405 [Saprospiraceae bacterium]|nr:hypothetical protein [Saprospiraceae bacterium]HNM26827.1 hypothetical protein [Saprospiraceae bacterium]
MSPPPKRVYPRQIRDKLRLSLLLDQLLCLLADSPLQVSLRALSYDTHIPAGVFERLSTLRHDPADAPNIELEDFYIVFSNVLFRYPTVKIFRQADGELFFTL